jgi:protein N-terminal glutamine amidohydrolase
MPPISASVAAHHQQQAMSGWCCTPHTRRMSGVSEHSFVPDNDPPYQPFYCEENVWLLAQDQRCGPGERLVALITGAQGHVAMWQQKLAEAPGEPVLWDYHVVLFVADRAGWNAWDFECTLGMPIPAATWLTSCFPYQDRIPPRYQPRFRVLPAAEYVATLRSDRSHMRQDDGTYAKPPPSWTPPGGGQESNLVQFVDLRQTFVGEVMDLSGLGQRLLTP